ncbi:hypothetical protein MLD38_015999 [Melastoma candidum]|uniref:Uncharacterized protein n=1 Tax=Melastoma candidum TaxID=119954 RepID=A0ACB9RRG0_9MYRT|nr:hypothetical protein MLD38_015999 [Melastoma candidum]
MSVNHFSASFPESFWRGQPLHYDPVPGSHAGFDFNLNRPHGDGYELGTSERDLLFEKPLTPSDVGKLNRLVIPKQHAERCFPLGGLGPGVDADSGMLLSFEDESGKCWRFRYSYWSSSQSYVLTKGWSRYVKEKRLDAGDVVLFERHRVNGDRLFIGWRRKGDVAAAEPPIAGRGWTGEVTQRGSESGGAIAIFGPDHGAYNAGSSSSSGNSKRFRLFGVNLEYCQHQQQPDDDLSDGSRQHYHYSDAYNGNFYNYMDANRISN